jgi:hypothetical protein
MRDRLPVELLSHILHLAAPLDYSPSFDLERRSLLSNYSLVSKRICDVAQPILNEVLVVRKLHEAGKLTLDERGRRNAQKVKLLVLRDIGQDQRKSKLRLNALFGFFSRVQEVRVLGLFSFQFDWLGTLPSALSSSFSLWLYHMH